VQYGFAIDQRTCIGCHACTVACKTEHDIPVGQFRTWVKYVEKGEFPTTSREFGVMRCNHCTDAPCVNICPTHALFKRDDGIVDFDGENCIGCKSCMQACPYDAIYIDAETNTAAKCNFCAHRVDQDLEPACVVVCPTHSIWVGDLDDPGSGISRLVNTNPTAVRAPERDTGPNVFYLGADRAVLDPLAAPVDGTYIWAQPDQQRLDMARDGYGDTETKARTTLNTAHPRPWGWRVTTYLWTKAVGAGALLFAALGLIFGLDLGPIGRFVAPVLGIAGAASTGALLVWDLKRPERFLYLFLRPNRTSWLVWGGVALSACAGGSGLWLLFGDFSVLRWPAIPVTAMTAGYTAFLFGQAKGRQLWQSPMLFWHLIVQAAMVGSGALLVAAPFTDLDTAATHFLTVGFAVSAGCHLLFLAFEYGGGHSGRGTAIAAHLVSRGRYAKTFWLGGVLPVVVAIPLVFLGPAAGVLCGLVVQAGLLAYESVFVRAGQDVPLS
jgi:Fe-S-cluster-containing dehydrogenase component/formate-dependent nitrite reductase membrane component NrfD